MTCNYVKGLREGTYRLWSEGGLRLVERGYKSGEFHGFDRRWNDDGLMVEETEYDDFSYVWDQDQFDPIRQRATCYIHFKFPDGSKLKRAFTYEWRMYTIPEVRDALRDAGFDDTRVYWEGTDPETEEGDGVYTESETADNDAAWVCYIAGFKS